MAKAQRTTLRHFCSSYQWPSGMRVLSIAALSALAGCSHGPTASKPDTVQLAGCVSVIGVSPPSARLFVGDTIRFASVGQPCSPPDFGPWFGWRSSDSTVASVDPLLGLVKARAAGTVTITLFWISDPTIKGAAAVGVSAR